MNITFDDLEDSEFTGAAPVARPNPAYGNAGAPFGASELGGFWQACGRCGGTGRYGNFGTCFACQGAKGKTLKTAPAVRAKARAQAADRRDRKQDDNLATFKVEFPAEWAWIESRIAWEAKTQAGDFGSSLRSGIVRYGSLTERQLAAVRTNMAKRAAAIEAAGQRVAE